MSQEFETIYQRVAQEMQERGFAEIEIDIPIVTHTVAIEHGENQLGKKQDFATSGQGQDYETCEPVQWAGVFDGHGSNAIIREVRNQASYAALAGNPCKALQERLCQTQTLHYESSGSTAVFAKVYENRALVQSVGDSSAIVLMDGVPIWQNVEHKWSNLLERARLSAMDPLIYAAKSRCTRVSAPQVMRSEPSVYVTWPNGVTKLAMTQALGHDGITGIEPDQFSFSLQPGHHYKIIAFSDGVGDMLIKESQEEMASIYKMSCAEIIEFATSRWRQNWFSPDPNNPEVLQGPWRYSLPEHFDDISCFVINIDPIPFK
jgi:serine/threonine protein phosphatase PrpC